jgi:hypothetical protein
LSSVVGVVLPLVYHQEWLAHPVGFVITVDYTLVVPLLVASYLYLLGAASTLLSRSELNDLNLTGKSFPTRH